jgi:hypothetical protein
MIKKINFLFYSILFYYLSRSCTIIACNIRRMNSSAFDSLIFNKLIKRDVFDILNKFLINTIDAFIGLSRFALTEYFNFFLFELILVNFLPLFNQTIYTFSQRAVLTFFFQAFFIQNFTIYTSLCRGMVALFTFHHVISF